jgi:hypothetical protein
MQSASSTRSVAERITELRGAQPADTTVRNLLAALTAKLDLSSRLPVYELEAHEDGCEACAALFQRLTMSEHQAVSALLDGLRDHLEHHMTASTNGDGVAR